jgi:hypothetical protein
MEKDKNNISNEKEDILKKFIKEETSRPTNSQIIEPQTNMDTQAESMVYGREYFSIDPKSLPSGIFYKDGVRISIRASSVSDVQEYSVVDDSNIIDVTEKMNTMLSRCVRYIHPNGVPGTYKNIKDNDRLSLIFMIRELTFQKGNNLAKEVTCEHCEHEFKIEFRSTNAETHRRTFEYFKIDDELKDFFNNETKTIDIEIGNKLWKLSPPNIGLQEIFFGDLKTKVQVNNKTPNVSFLKIIPFTLWDRDTITEDGIKAKEIDYKKMDMDTFQTLNYIVDKMKFGVKGLIDKCPVCGGEVHTDISFPGGASNIFVISSPLERFKKK